MCKFCESEVKYPELYYSMIDNGISLDVVYSVDEHYLDICVYDSCSGLGDSFEITFKYCPECGKKL